eukprot:TRINITY_DN11544_c0_g1_i1.p1 TRINITY_DN11544_c0_g1~~TRINITY_DN11544_c0_g1_i1.p1  ORF type:complete len:307 (-),score=111.03 TRINITY_DN11544_c0_g1_i1:393-1313(-)
MSSPAGSRRKAAMRRRATWLPVAVVGVLAAAPLRGAFVGGTQRSAAAVSTQQAARRLQRLPRAVSVEELEAQLAAAKMERAKKTTQVLEAEIVKQMDVIDADEQAGAGEDKLTADRSKLGDLLYTFARTRELEGAAFREDILGRLDGEAKRTAEHIIETATSAGAAAAEDFTGKEDWTTEDVKTEVDNRIRAAVGREGGDETLAEAIILSIDERAKAEMAAYTGKEKYEFGDFSTEMGSRLEGQLAKFTGKEEYQFGDVSKELLRRTGIPDRVKSFTGKEEYQFGDISKTAAKKFMDWFDSSNTNK